MTELFTDDETQRMMLEAAVAMGEFQEQDIIDMCEAMHTLAITTALLENWRQGHLHVGWNIDKKELQWKMTTKGHKTVQEMGALNV